MSDLTAIRRAYWEDYVRRTAQALAVRHIDCSIEICVNRAVELADAVEAAIEKKFPRNTVDLSIPLDSDPVSSDGFPDLNLGRAHGDGR